jgi:hypothetical protein
LIDLRNAPGVTSTEDGFVNGSGAKNDRLALGLGSDTPSGDVGAERLNVRCHNCPKQRRDNIDVTRHADARKQPDDWRRHANADNRLGAVGNHIPFTMTCPDGAVRPSS